MSSFGAFIPLAIFAVVAGVVGIRLLRLWQKSHETPELMLGFGLVLMSCVAIPLTGVGRIPSIALQPVGRAAFALGIFCVAGGMLLVVAFTREVFRRDATWAAWLLGMTALGVVTQASWIAWANLTGASLAEILAQMRPAALALLATLALCFAWSSAESFVYYKTMRRRLALGLADPVLTNRFLLWALAGTAAAVLVAVLISCMLDGRVILRDQLSLNAIAAIGTLMSGAWYLTFFPPAGYQRLIESRAGKRN
jgi:hypothetical protein